MPATLNAPQHVSPLDRYTPAVPPPLPDHPVIAAVMAGQRYVAIPYVVSIMIMSFRRTLGGVQLVETGQWPMGQVLGATLITLLFGWWGIPWGFIWSPAALFSLWFGGRDFTLAVLTDIVGAAEAKRILAIAPKPRPPASIWLVRLFILIPVVLVVMMFTGILLPSHL